MRGVFLGGGPFFVFFLYHLFSFFSFSPFSFTFSNSNFLRFSFDEMLDLKGDTAVYLLYAHARIASIVRKAGKDVSALAREKKIQLDHDDERALALAVARFPEAVEDALSDLSPNRLCDYLYSLTEAFNQFYGSCKVVGSAEEDSRLLLCEATAVVIRQVFALLGLTPLYRL